MDQSHPVRLEHAAPRGIACVPAHLPPAEVPRRFGEFLDQVYAAGKRGEVTLDGQNIFVYREAADGQMDIEFGVGTSAPFAPVGNVRYAALPTGEVAATTHWGDYGGLKGAHAAVVAWCRANGHRRAGTLWEIYGHWRDDPAERRTDIYHLLA